jgi:gliding motility-associated-like protein
LGAPVITDVNCAGDSTGAITVTPNGGTPPYTYLWSDGQLTVTAGNLPAGIYSVTVTDNSGCAASSTYTVAESPMLTLQVNTTTALCADPTSGSATAVPGGGDGTYTYSWSNTGSTATISSLQGGAYLVTVTDGLGCTITGSGTVNTDSIVIYPLGPDRNICEGDSVTIGAGFANAVWSTGAVGDSITVNSAGELWASGNCATTDTVAVIVTTPPEVPELNITDTMICEGDAVVLIVTDEGHLYVWSTGDTATQTTVDTAGVYIVNAINNCGRSSAEATVYDSLCSCRIYMPNAFSPNGKGSAENEEFRAYSLCNEVAGFELKIFDRWGSLVFHTNDFHEGWDGTTKGRECEPGVYVWYVSYHSKEPDRNRVFKIKGGVTLMK